MEMGFYNVLQLEIREERGKMPNQYAEKPIGGINYFDENGNPTPITETELRELHNNNLLNFSVGGFDNLKQGSGLFSRLQEDLEAGNWYDFIRACQTRKENITVFYQNMMKGCSGEEESFDPHDDAFGMDIGDGNWIYWDD